MRGQKDYIRVSATIPRKAKKEERRLMYSSGRFIEAPGGTKSLIKAQALKGSHMPISYDSKQYCNI